MSDQPNSQPQGSLTEAPPAPEVKLKTWREPTLSRTEPSRIAAVLAMDQLGVPRTEIAKKEGMSTASVYAIIRQGDHIDPAIVEGVKKRYAAHWWITGERALQGITPEKIEAASASQLGILAAVSTDKALLLEGKPTSRVEYMTAEDTQAADQIKALEAELSGWKDGTTLNVEGVVEGEGTQPPTE